eukprot:1150770-Pelagomonas_calceolata.AAC.5
MSKTILSTRHTQSACPCSGTATAAGGERGGVRARDRHAAGMKQVMTAQEIMIVFPSKSDHEAWLLAIWALHHLPYRFAAAMRLFIPQWCGACPRTNTHLTCPVN